MTEQEMYPVNVGLDDGYAYTKLALPNGRLIVIPSRARIGRANVTWIDNAEQRIFEYETEGQIFSIGEVDGESTYFDTYPFSGLNRVIVQHGLQKAGLGGHSVHAVSGLPVSSFYLKDGNRREATLTKKRDSLKRAVHPVDDSLPAAIAFHEVIPEALAAWYDHVITESDDGVQLNAERLQAPLAVVDIGGRTTDYVVVVDQAVLHASSGSLRCGLLDVKREVAEGIQSRFDMEVVNERVVEAAIQRGIVRLYGKDHDISDMVKIAQRQIVERIYVETQRQLGGGAELEQILFVGGGTVALATSIQGWFPNQVVANHPAFANARGMLKYLQYVCESPDSA